MKKSAITVLIACVLCMAIGCTDKKKAVAEDEMTTDSIADSTDLDSLESSLDETPVPKAADELFDDFIFNFASNRKMQMKRIQFPLKVVSGSYSKQLTKGQWKMERFFMPQGFYTLVLDAHKQLELSKDTSINHVVVEKINLTAGNVDKYHFDRLAGEWNLTSLEQHAAYEKSNASFLHFYQQFATDTLFQLEHLNEEIKYKGPDPEDEYKDLKCMITPDDWLDMGPGELPSGLIYNILYGQQYVQGNQKIFLLRGISNGQEMKMTFRRNDGEWKLVGVEL